MAFSSTTKLSELPFRNSIPFSSSHPSLTLLFSPKKTLPFSFKLFFSISSLRTPSQNQPRTNPRNNNPPYPWDENGNPRKTRIPSASQKSRAPSAPWLQKWPANKNTIEEPKKIRADEAETRYFERDKGNGALERIVHRLRNLGLGLEDGEEDENSFDSDAMPPYEGEEKLGDLLQRTWKRPDSAADFSGKEETVLPWERGWDDGEKDELKGSRKIRVKAPSLAELTIEDSELKRLRKQGIVLRERINVAKAGVTQTILDKIHDAWRKSELVRLRFHESLAHDMKTAHEIVERRTGGLVIWRSGSVMVVYRGSNYERPSSRSQSSDGLSISTKVTHEGENLFVPDVSLPDSSDNGNGNNAISSTPEKTSSSVTSHACVESLTAEEAEFDSLLDGLGPRFVDWWGTGLLPVDADLLPQQIPGYKTPFRLLPTGMRPRLTNAELTTLRKLARKLPCHFALGRNRHHHGLASAIVKLWHKSTVVKIAVKRGIQNTNNKLMAEELKTLTGGILLLRNKFYIVIYRGKDFVPTSVAAALAEREELTKNIHDFEEKARSGVVGAAYTGVIEGGALAGTLAEFHEAQARWGRQISAEEHEKMKEDASRAKSSRIVKRIEHKLDVAQAKKLRAERLLAKIEVSMVPVGPSDDQETITDEERFMFRRVGLRMKAYLPLGIRGVFDGVIENMHLHWKHRELVKLISKQKTLAFVEDTARLLEYESGGILVAIERVPKGYALIYYRGKNYQRPISIRPRNLLTKAKALKRSVAMQRHEALSQHISELENTIEQMKSELGDSVDVGDRHIWNSKEQLKFGGDPEFTQSENEGSCLESDDDEKSEF
ncbi:CRS1 / YhbY (CRM) domain-containing protein [Tasmannia lanceolata]|uniref:CRS1 / YhbY (CRM) domain-containing protein n=1 Tax=Tasmannia lanceolata TaxID=3420 RepID=UPI004063C334